MTGDFGEGMADIATGAMVGRAVEPRADGAAQGIGGHTAEGACLNCGTPLAGPHCHRCGQRAHVHRTLRAFFHDLLHGVLHFEGKTWRTLPLLVWKPGKLTRDYIEGKRASYVSPIALFLFVVFLSFALFSMLGGSEMFGPDRSPIAQAKAAYAENEEQLVELRAERARTAPSDTDALARIDKRIAGLEEDQQGLEMIPGNVGTEVERDFKEGFERDPLPSGNKISAAIERVQANPQLMIYKVQTNAYKFSWMLIPLSVPFVWLLFPFSRRFGGYDHTVFATYSIAFMIALVALASLLFTFNWAFAGLLLLMYAPVHMYRQLRGTYQLGRWGALWRMTVLSVCAWVAIALFVVAISAMAA
ncbi:MAG TPA: DUF3667 domain-containing protein [Qipengyuania sp.]|nr:DUF3667 domain-containing protein [Qipengyuania sp.]